MNIIKGRLPKKGDTITKIYNNALEKAVAVENEFIKKSLAKIDIKLARMLAELNSQPKLKQFYEDRNFKDYNQPSRCKKIKNKSVIETYEQPKEVQVAIPSYNPICSTAQFEVEKPLVPTNENKKMTPIQARIEAKHEQEASMWRSKLRAISHARRYKKGIKRALKYASATNKGFPLFKTNYPSCPHFDRPCANEGVHIYVLVDPIDNTVRYVGKTTNLAKRAMYHTKYEQGNNALWEWKKSINFKFHMYSICYVSFKHRNIAEQQWIAYFRQMGYIYNIKKGG